MKKIVIYKETLYQLYVVEQKSLTEISEILNLNRSTVIDYLKKGEKCNKCNYSKNITRKIGDEKRSGKNNCNSKSIICITTKEIFNTLTEGANKYNIKR